MPTGVYPRKIKPKDLCSVEGCVSFARSFGLCETHYYRQRRGSPLGLTPVNQQCAYCRRGLARNQSKFCSEQCCTRFRRSTLAIKLCKSCGREFINPGTNRTTCSKECREVLDAAGIQKWRETDRGRESLRNREYRRKMRKAGRVCEDFTRTEIFERDGWVCRICGEPVDRNAKWPQPRFATIDHILAIANGGTHTRDNVQCAHLICNVRKNDQLAIKVRNSMDAKADRLTNARKPKGRPIPGSKRSGLRKRMDGTVERR
jgi:hypothetical protein